MGDQRAKTILHPLFITPASGVRLSSAPLRIRLGVHSISGVLSQIRLCDWSYNHHRNAIFLHNDWISCRIDMANEFSKFILRFRGGDGVKHNLA